MKNGKNDSETIPLFGGAFFVLWTQEEVGFPNWGIFSRGPFPGRERNGEDMMAERVDREAFVQKETEQ
ncbi:hypothetical protein COI59_28985 [Bacillus toyonensis]|nr:hypothetical protein COI59_28985 [Bacillus toyonensis]